MATRFFGLTPTLNAKFHTYLIFKLLFCLLSSRNKFKRECRALLYIDLRVMCWFSDQWMPATYLESR